MSFPRVYSLTIVRELRALRGALKRVHESPPLVSCCLPLAACLSLGTPRGGGGVHHGLASHHQFRSNRAGHCAGGRSSRAPSAIITATSALATTVPLASRISSQPSHLSTIRCPLALGAACAGLQWRPGGREQLVQADLSSATAHPCSWAVVVWLALGWRSVLWRSDRAAQRRY